MTHVPTTGSPGWIPLADLKGAPGEPGPPGPPPTPGVATHTLAGGVVPSLAAVNYWTVPSAMTLTLPAAPVGASYMVHVKSGFPNITWPNGTVVFGSTTTSEAWVSLTRGPDGWQVLVPSAPSPTIDSGWKIIFNAYDFGQGVQFDTGSAANLPAGWTIPVGLTTVQVRRTGGLFLVHVSGGFRKTATGTSGTFFTIPNPLGSGLFGDSVGNSALSSIVVGGTVETPARYAISMPVKGAQNANSFWTLSVPNGQPEGTIVKTPNFITFTIDPTSVWQG